ncbi:hypothetical protein PAL_GLEAN10008159 [Pteropus alecto]|uniref:Uncharacterized protein n=1 Tax=Pteropus alecto TaxID=9402 RepID=L5K3N5_PTEAL|nr:hypothetical protein PAL_GLEAN10008159 [Pteropus alecto]
MCPRAVLAAPGAASVCHCTILYSALTTKQGVGDSIDSKSGTGNDTSDNKQSSWGGGGAPAQRKWRCGAGLRSRGSASPSAPPDGIAASRHRTVYYVTD